VWSRNYPGLHVLLLDFRGSLIHLNNWSSDN